MVRKIEPGDFIRVSNEARLIAIGEKSNGRFPRNIWFADMDRPKVELTISAVGDPAYCSEWSAMQSHFVAIPGRGQILAMLVGDDKRRTLLGVDISLDRPALKPLPIDYLKHSRPAGSTLGGEEGLLLTRRDKGLSLQSGGDGVQVSPEDWRLEEPSGALIVRNSEVALVLQQKQVGGFASGVLFVFDERQGTWKPWSVPSWNRGPKGYVAFGAWVAATETADRVPGATEQVEPIRGGRDYFEPERWDTRVPTGPHFRDDRGI